MKTIVALIMFALAFTGCATSGIDGNRQALTYASKSLSLSADTFVAGDLVYQRAIAKDAEKHQHYRLVIQPKVLLAFAEARAALAAWRAASELYVIGKAEQKDVDAAAAEAYKLLDAVRLAVVAALGGK